MNFFLYSRLPNKCFATKYKSFKNSQFVLAVIVTKSIEEKNDIKYFRHYSDDKKKYSALFTNPIENRPEQSL
jgi:hypothetical protein